MPYCYSNTKRETHLQYYRFPTVITQAKKELSKKWINLKSRKNFVPGASQSVLRKFSRRC